MAVTKLKALKCLKKDPAFSENENDTTTIRQMTSGQKFKGTTRMFEPLNIKCI